MNRFYSAIRKNVKFKKFIILCLNLKGKSNFSSTLFLIEKSRSNLNIEDRIDGFIENRDTTRIQSLKGLPVFIHVSGAGVVTKELSEHLSYNNVQKVLPNFNLNDFIVQIDNLENNKSILTVIRKDQIDILLKKTNLNDLCFSGIFMGVSPVIALCNNFEEKNDTIDFGETSLIIHDGKASGIAKGSEKNDSIFFMDEKRDIQTIFALSCAIHVSLSPLSYTHSFQHFINGSSESIYSKYSKQFIKTGLAVIFALLLINYFCFDFLFTKQNNQALQISTRENMLSQLSDIQTKLKNKQNFILITSLEQSGFSSYYSDQIGLNTTEGIKLTKLCINPLQKKIKTNEILEFKNDVIQLEGKAESVSSYREFLSNIERSKWCEKISFQDYHYEPGSKSADFVLEIITDAVITK
ncbi:hypothetical protein [Draconibacterium mangrovi]|uniref:hypothetical protein n=1 Tax=Draconibacterium mangrovi TaxID=2697469 RepID=UPI0013D7DA86|nr:hypothetical protein [Draconibacterium mangrovi]